MATHCSVLAWRIPWIEPGGLQSGGLQKSRTQVTRLSTQRTRSLGCVCAGILQFQCLHLPLLGAGDCRPLLNLSEPQFSYRLLVWGLDASLGVHTQQPLIKD